MGGVGGGGDGDGETREDVWRGKASGKGCLAPREAVRAKGGLCEGEEGGEGGLGGEKGSTEKEIAGEVGAPLWLRLETGSGERRPDGRAKVVNWAFRRVAASRAEECRRSRRGIWATASPTSTEKRVSVDLIAEV